MRQILVLFFVFFSYEIFAQQGLEKLQEERLESQKRVQEIDRILQNTRQKYQNNEASLRALNIQAQEIARLIRVIGLEIEFLEQKITQITQDIEEQNHTLKEHVEEFKNVVYNTSKNHDKIGPLSLIFSSESYQQFRARLKYFNQYSEFREKKIKRIKNIRQELTHQKKDLEMQKEAKKELLRQKKLEKARIVNLKSDRKQMMGVLKSQEQQLRLDLQKEKGVNHKLTKVLVSTFEKSYSITPKANNITLKGASFEENKSHLVWPIMQGFVSRKFGKQPHPVEPKIMVDNLGIDIRTPTNESIKAVFSGVIELIHHVPNDLGYTVMIRHDKYYYTVYKNLKNVKVKLGQAIKTGQSIGQVKANSNNISELQFQVWKGRVRLNPIEWLANL